MSGRSDALEPVKTKCTVTGVAMLAFLFVFAGCQWQQLEQTDLSKATSIKQSPVTFSYLYNNVIRPEGCAAAFCHSSDLLRGNMDLSSRQVAYAALVGVAASGEACHALPLQRVAPGNAELSLLFLKLGSDPPCGLPMPSALGRLSEENIALVRQWIEEGAKNN